MKSVFVDIVSDIVCPWCALGYHRLKRAAEVLLDIVDALDLDRHAAEAILSRGVLADFVKENERRWQGQGIHAVPAMIFPDRRLVNGAQTIEHYEQHIRRALTGELAEWV
jgi:predicted DsbA family dithiol-disulfide isomerase